MVAVSKRNIKEADRVGGAIWILPWPASMPLPSPPFPRHASKAEHAAASLLIREACDCHRLVPVRTEIRYCRHPIDTAGVYPPKYRMAVLVIGYRWVDATGYKSRIPAECWIGDTDYGMQSG